MSTRQDTAQGDVVRSNADLVQWIADGEKPASEWRLGTEHEKFVFDLETKLPVPYEGDRGIRQLMTELMSCCGWAPIIENGNVIALKRAAGEAGDNISLEPGGQFELSGAPLENVHETFAETRTHIEEAKRVAHDLGLGFLGLGFTPTWKHNQISTMPKQRYQVMTKYMPTVGSHGLDMMYRTATIQVNLDFASEQDLIDKMRVSLALQPIATALFASSPFTEGKPNGFKSMRSEVWRDTDPARTGMLPFVFEDGMGYEAYVEYALDVPMYFVYRDGRYVDVAGASFRDFIAGKLHGFEGQHPTLDDWSDHLTTIFPEIRLKKFLEMRGADSGPPEMICALTAFWAGILYDKTSLQACLDLVSDWTEADRLQLRLVTPKEALSAPFREGSVLDLAAQVLDLSRAGLKRRGNFDSVGEDESAYLRPLFQIVGHGETMADRLLSLYKTSWDGDISRVYDEWAY
ncbi:MAG: glutamate--cysteine ligase [Hyphomicrobiaceae bacterium]